MLIVLLLLQGDILIRVNNVKVTSVRQANRLIEKSKGDRYQSLSSFTKCIVDKISLLVTFCAVGIHYPYVHVYKLYTKLIDRQN